MPAQEPLDDLPESNAGVNPAEPKRFFFQIGNPGIDLSKPSLGLIKPSLDLSKPSLDLRKLRLCIAESKKNVLESVLIAMLRT